MQGTLGPNSLQLPSQGLWIPHRKMVVTKTVPSISHSCFLTFVEQSVSSSHSCYFYSRICLQLSVCHLRALWCPDPAPTAMLLAGPLTGVSEHLSPGAPFTHVLPGVLRPLSFGPLCKHLQLRPSALPPLGFCSRPTPPQAYPDTPQNLQILTVACSSHCLQQCQAAGARPVAQKGKTIATHQ